jgi:signal transduction histidine kinase/ABC-type sugar transport system substrate-binding protein/ActR/RegA family two-component response regulator
VKGRSPIRPRVGVFCQGLVGHRQEWLGSVDAARALDCDLIVFPGREVASPEPFLRECNAVYDLASRDCLDALAIWTTSLELHVGHEWMESFRRSLGSLPMVSIEGELPDAPSVIMDNVRGTEALLDHLLDEHGYRRIAFVRGPTNNTGAQTRLRTVIEHLAARGVGLDPALVTPAPQAWLPDLAAASTRALLRRCAEPPEVIMAANDDLALGVISALEEAGLAVPADVCVTGFDAIADVRSGDVRSGDLRSGDLRGSDAGMGMARRMNVHPSIPSLTTVRAPFYELGWRSIELAASLARGEPTPELLTVPTSLVVNRSCGCFPVGDPVPRRRAATRTAFGWLGEAPEPALPIRLKESLRGELQVLAATLPPDWADRLTQAAMAEVETPTGGVVGGAFLGILDEFIRASAGGERGLQRWGRALADFQRTLEAGVPPGPAGDRARDLGLQVQSLLRATAEWVWNIRSQAAAKRDQILREVGQTLVKSSTAEGVAAALADQLARLRVPSCYLALYGAPAGAPDSTDEQRRKWVRLLLGHHNAKSAETSSTTHTSTGTAYPARWLVPGDRLRRDTASCFVVQALFSNDEQLGFLLLEVGPRLAWIYEALQGLTSSALQAALMVDRERRALAAAEAAHLRFTRTLTERDRLLQESGTKTRGLEQEIDRRSAIEAQLHSAHAELERRVAERTAELASTHAELTRQVEERERAEATKAALESQLRHAQKMDAIGRLAGGLAHDFNNLLVVINGNTEAVLRRSQAEDPRRTELEEIAHAGDRAARLTRQLLAFSRQQVLRPEPIDPNDIIAGVLAMLHRLLGEHVRLTTRLTHDIGSVVADVGQLEQIILNLALNARDAMPDGGELTIATSLVHTAGGPEIRIRVQDTGVGMTDDVRGRLFEPFFTTKAVGKGTGLGLATVFGIVEQTGGRIAVDSALGAGTTFDILLPRTERPSAQLPADPYSVDLPGTKTILLAEDDPAVRGTILRFLGALGCVVLVAVDGLDALRISARHDGPIDLIVTDLVMPSMGGRELAERLRPLRPQTPILFVSGYANDRLSTVDDTFERWQVLEKPFTGDQLARAVRDAIQRGVPDPSVPGSTAAWQT